MKIHVRSVLLTLAALAALGAVGAGAVVGFGLYNVSARVGHWPGVSWILNTTFRNSAALRAPAADTVPELTDAMAALGARHYDTACRVCHAAPGQEKTATTRAMVPEPPHITEAVQTWSPAELHWIVDEGVKMSGMPYWPADRPDEVWPVVAFLMEVKAGMTGQRYDRLAGRDDGRAPEGFAYCASCHGATGAAGNPDIPRLDILSQTYMTQSLAAYLSGARGSGIMAQAASEAPEGALPGYARRFAAIAPAGERAPPTSLGAAGEAIAMAGVPGSDVPACAACHGPWPEPLDPAYPSLSGQYRPYLEAQLRLWRDGARGGTRVAGLMHEAARRLSDADIAAVSAWYAGRAPARIPSDRARPAPGEGDAPGPRSRRPSPDQGRSR
ncbi:c-type cytochrome [Palleronia rufa]|uniref:c-type cytochrome n=1 Tax=Palleronia rufa TaxID=1530186 RepID=UPI0009DC9BBA|nr:c-type cytochrome [Palleronia rufa]